MLLKWSVRPRATAFPAGAHVSHPLHKFCHTVIFPRGMFCPAMKSHEESLSRSDGEDSMTSVLMMMKESAAAAADDDVDGDDVDPSRER